MTPIAYKTLKGDRVALFADGNRFVARSGHLPDREVSNADEWWAYVAEAKAIDDEEAELYRLEETFHLACLDR